MSQLRREARAAYRSLESLLSYTNEPGPKVAIQLELDTLGRALGEHKHNPWSGTRDFLGMCVQDSRELFCRLSGATP